MPSYKRILFWVTLLLVVLIPSSFFIYKESFYWDKSDFIIPVQYIGEIPIRSDIFGDGKFGAKRKNNRLHNGIDILVPYRAPVRAVKGGLAIAGEEKRGMGKYVVIKHKRGLTTVYGHLSDIYIKSTQMVRQGDVIGAVGKSGNASHKAIKPHLHFEIRKNGKPLNPKYFLKPFET